MLKIAVIGPESTGKSTLCQQLGAHFNAKIVSEYAREYLADLHRPYDIHDVVAIAQGQQRHIESFEASQPEMLISDTEGIVNKVWCEYVFHTIPKEINNIVNSQHFDLYLLCDTDLEWAFDPMRENPNLNERKAIFALYLKALDELGANYRIISGTGQARTNKAIEAIKEMSEKQRHIVFLARWYPHKYDPMFGLFVQRHAEAAALYNSVSVVYVHADASAKDTFDIERSMERGVDTIRIYYKKANKLLSVWRFFKACQKGLQLAGKADLIHVHVLTRMGLIALREKRKNGTPYLITEHWSRYLPGNAYSGWLRKKLTRTVVREAAMVTTVNANLSQAMKSHGLENERWALLQNVVDSNLFKPQPHQNAIPKIVHVSCFEDKSKNISGLLQALYKLKTKGIAYQAVLIGDGIDYERMRRKADELHLNDIVRFTGVLEGQDLVNELATGDFFVLSSNYETASIVIIEALMCGVPVVSTQVGCAPEVINASNGILVPTQNVEALTEAMEKMCERYTQYSSDLLRKAVVDQYGYEKIGQLLTRWYQDIISPR